MHSPNLTAQLTLTQDTDCLLEQLVCLLHSSLLSQLQPCPLLRATFGSDSASKHVWKLVVTGNLWRTLVSEIWTRWCLQLRPFRTQGPRAVQPDRFVWVIYPWPFGIVCWVSSLVTRRVIQERHRTEGRKIPVCLYCRYLWWEPPWDGGDEPTVREIIIKAWGRECPSKHS